jgi:glyoxylase-like metal-dependent hydrolase (beta-lactamase superfamily II)
MNLPAESVREYETFTLQTLAPGVHAVIGSWQTGSVANSGIVDLGDRTLVFDTFMTVPAARELQQAALELTGRPATWVINSHPHPDHIHGNIVFGDEATIIATSATREDLLKTGHRWLEDTRSDMLKGLEAAKGQPMAAMFQRILDGLPSADQLRFPTVAFDKRLSLHGTARRAELITFGGGHSPSDMLMWLPDERILFTADVVVSGGHPLLVHGDAKGWLQILDEINGLGAEIIVPGHGLVQGADATAMVRQYITDLLGLAERAVRNGITPEEVEMPEAYQQMAVAHLFIQNLAFLMGQRPQCVEDRSPTTRCS